MKGVRLNANQKREFDRLVLEISARERCSPEEILEEIRPILESRRTGGQKADAVLKTLRDRRSPEWARRSAALRRIKQDLGLRARGIDIDPPPYFDGDRFRFAFAAKNPAEFRLAAEALLQADPKRLEELFELLR